MGSNWFHRHPKLNHPHFFVRVCPERQYAGSDRCPVDRNCVLLPSECSVHGARPLCDHYHWRRTAARSIGQVHDQLGRSVQYGRFPHLHTLRRVYQLLHLRERGRHAHTRRFAPDPCASTGHHVQRHRHMGHGLYRDNAAGAICYRSQVHVTRGPCGRVRAHHPVRFYAAVHFYSRYHKDSAGRQSVRKRDFGHVDAGQSFWVCRVPIRVVHDRRLLETRVRDRTVVLRRPVRRMR